MTPCHIPVLRQEVVSLLVTEIGRKGIIVDCTLGGGGHSRDLLEAMGPQAVLIGIDQDKKALETAYENLKSLENKKTFIHDNFEDLQRIMESQRATHAETIFFDLGVSSSQLDEPDRGFSFRNNGPLDMRMDQMNTTTAKTLVNRLSPRELTDIIKQYGEEVRAAKIARAIVKYRQQESISSTEQLRRIIEKAAASFYDRKRIHCATKTFQALRIVVNDELGALSRGLAQAIDSLASGGRIGVISYHSLEDRVVKHMFRDNKSRLKILTKKPVRPGEDEVADNPRSRSARLRVAEKKVA